MTMMHRLRAVHSFPAGKQGEPCDEQDADRMGCHCPQQLARLNGSTAKSIALQLQFAYYLFLCDDPASAAQVLEMAHKA